MLVSTRGEGSARSKSWVQKPGFSSCKTQAPIIYGQRWHRDMLVQLTLDAAVRQIKAGPGSASTEILDLLVETGAGVARLLAIRDEFVDPVGPEDQTCIRLRRSMVLKEPRLSNARLIWSMRKKIVPPADRLRILMRLQAAQAAGLPISALIPCVAAASIEAVDAILSLACEGLLSLDIDIPLVPETIVRIRPAPNGPDGSDASRSHSLNPETRFAEQPK